MIEKKEAVGSIGETVAHSSPLYILPFFGFWPQVLRPAV